MFLRDGIIYVRKNCMQKLSPLLVLLLFFAFSHPLPAGEKPDSDQVFGLPSFIFRVDQSPAANGKETSVVVNIGIVNDVLQFVKTDGDRYKASYEISVDFLDAQNSQVTGQIINRKIWAENFEETNSQHELHHDALPFDLPPGSYNLHLDIMDMDTHKHLIRDEKISVTDFFDGKPHVSTVIFLQRANDMDSIKQNLAKIVTEIDQPLFAQFFVAGFSPQDSIHLQYALRDWDGQTLDSWQNNALPTDKRLAIREVLNAHIRMPGQFELQIKCLQKDRVVEAKERFSVKAHRMHDTAPRQNLPANISFGPLRYIISGNEFKRIASADSLEQQQLVQEFWQSRDPSSETPENELRDEFYRRVEFANEHFSNPSEQKPGWNTDRGRIYITHGQPDLVHTQSNQIGEASVEIWYFKSIDKRFVFRDKKGNGDFELVYEE